MSAQELPFLPSSGWLLPKPVPALIRTDSPAARFKHRANECSTFPLGLTVENKMKRGQHELL